MTIIIRNQQSQVRQRQRGFKTYNPFLRERETEFVVWQQSPQFLGFLHKLLWLGVVVWLHLYSVASASGHWSVPEICWITIAAA